MHNIAVMLERGVGVRGDQAQALAWLRKAAAGGCVEAQRRLGQRVEQ
jgi:TPR repeat protein